MTAWVYINHVISIASCCIAQFSTSCFFSKSLSVGFFSIYRHWSFSTWFNNFSTFYIPMSSPRRGILLALRRRRGQREDKLRFSRVKRLFFGCHLWKHVLPWLGSCGFHRFNGMSRVLPRSPCARYSSLKQFLRIRTAKSFYFLPEHIMLINSV